MANGMQNGTQKKGYCAVSVELPVHLAAFLQDRADAHHGGDFDKAFVEAARIGMRLVPAESAGGKPPYCTQNGGDCSTCSLVSYGRDCRNNPVAPKGAV